MLPRSVRVSETEHELVKLAADEAGAPSVSAWMRQALKRQALRELAGDRERRTESAAGGNRRREPVGA